MASPSIKRKEVPPTKSCFSLVLGWLPTTPSLPFSFAKLVLLLLLTVAKLVLLLLVGGAKLVLLSF